MLNVARLAFATVAIAAMTYQFAMLNGPGYAQGNFFSFFTIQSNILAVGALFLLVLVPRERRTPLFDAARSAAVLYIAITGIVFALLLAGLQEELQTTIPWVDFVVHKLMPVVLVADWLVDPPRHRLPWWTVARLARISICVDRVHPGPRRDRRLVPVSVRGRVEPRVRGRARPRRGPHRRVRGRRSCPPLAREPARAGVSTRTRLARPGLR